MKYRITIADENGVVMDSTVVHSVLPTIDALIENELNASGTYQCDNCGEWFPDNELDDNLLCSNCS